jgi:putative transposase
MKAYRAIVINLPKDKCDVNYIRRLMALTNLAYRGYEVWVTDLPKNIQYKLYGSFKNFKGSLVFGTVPKGWFAKVWVPLNTLRVYLDSSMKGDRGAPVVLDFRSSVIRLRQVCRNESRYVVEVPMPRWVVDRVKEGGDIKYAMIGLKKNESYLVLVAEREVEPYTPNEYVLAVDVNSWNNGIAWGLIRNGTIIRWKPERPKLSEIERLYNLSIRLERKYGRLKRLSLHKTLEGKKLWRETKRLRRKIYAKLRDYVQKLVHRLVKKALRHKALVVIDDIIEESRKELLEKILHNGLAKIYLLYMRSFVKLFITQLQWYGVPYTFKRLYSTVCPICRHKLVQKEKRIMVCSNCGFKAPRDMISIYWAMKLNSNKLRGEVVNKSRV